MTKKTISELESEVGLIRGELKVARDRSEERNTENKKLQKRITTLKRMVANHEAKINRMAGYLDRVHEGEHPEKRAGHERRRSQDYHGETHLNPHYNVSQDSHSLFSDRNRDPDANKEWFEF